MITSFRSSHQRCSMKKVTFKNLAILTGLKACNFIKKTPHVFSWEYCKISRTPNLKNTFERLLLVIPSPPFIHTLDKPHQVQTSKNQVKTKSELFLKIVRVSIVLLVAIEKNYRKQSQKCAKQNKNIWILQSAVKVINFEDFDSFLTIFS